MKKRTITFLGICIILFAGIQFIRPKLENKPASGDFQAPAAVKSILVRACYDCHSDQTHLRWYDKLQPVFWQVADHVKKGRELLNFSNWDALAPPVQKAKLWESVNQIEQGVMPLSSYTFVHRDAKVSPEDLAVLKNYLLSMIQRKVDDSAATNALQRQYEDTVHRTGQLPKALNGITYIPDYKNWQVISTSERYDNNTLRIIYGNDIAIKAVIQNRINPWPEGTIFAKVAWDQLEDKNGNVRTGAFEQVEFMIKDTKRFSHTGGWGFARFKTPRLIPYGKTINFTQECINCHKPMSNNDLVFTFPIKN